MENTARHPVTITLANGCALVLRAASATAGIWARRLKTRRQLRELDARALEDIGRTETERRNECAKPFWQE